jgi:hypothetical protein
MRTGLKMLTAALCAGVSMTALAGDNVVPVFDSEKYFLSQMPAVAAPAAGGIERERPQAVNGSLYAVVAPLYVTPPFLSYLRLFNGGASAATFTITVVGSGTSNAYGTATSITNFNILPIIFREDFSSITGQGVRGRFGGSLTLPVLMTLY